MKNESISDMEFAYRLVRPNYLHLKDVIKRDIRDFLKKENLKTIGIQGRIKTFKSLNEKIDRKGYLNPFEEVEDLCGIRIICYYQEDLKKVETIIENEFEIIEKTDKKSILEDNQFGYNSIHYIIKIKSEYLVAPDYRNLEGLKAEIQVRTILAHAWAEIEHRLAYKSEHDIPQQFKRKISRISALLELADNEFDSLRKEKDDYQSVFVNQDGILASGFPFNLDGFQAFLSKYFPNRNFSLKPMRSLFSEIQILDISYQDIANGKETIGDRISEIEKEVFEKFESQSDPVLSQTGIVKLILDLTNEKYAAYRERMLSLEVKEFLDKWKKDLNLN